MQRKFVIRLKAAHDRSGLSLYAVAKQTGLAYNTVYKYLKVEKIIADKIETPVIVLAEFYGVDWRDPAVVEVVEDEDDEEDEHLLVMGETRLG